MPTPHEHVDMDDVPDAIVDTEPKGFPVVWLLPLVALLVGGWLFYKTMSEKGPEISITFETAEGIEQGKTQVKFRDVSVGQVSAVDIAEDLKSIKLTVSMGHGTNEYLTDASRFWVVKPRIGASGVSGLGTLFSGAYIAFEPDPTGKKQHHFVGLEQPPIVPIDKQGTKYRLRSETLGSLSVGAPVYFRQFDVGEITDYRLADDYSHVDVGVFIESPYDKFVREGSHFWNVGGISVDMSADGLHVEMESLVSMLSGGIAFDTLSKFTNSPVAKAGVIFPLFKNRTRAMQRPITEEVMYALKFDGTVRGLSVGAPVEYRGIRIGTVKEIQLGADPANEQLIIPVVIVSIEPQRVSSYKDVDQGGKARGERSEDASRKQVEFLVRHGLRAHLKTGNLVTGQLFIDLNIFPQAEPAEVVYGGLYPELPTLPNPLQGIVASVNRILAKVEEADLQGTLTNLNELMVSTNQLVATLEKSAPQMAENLSATLRNASQTMSTLNGVVSGRGELGSQLQSSLNEIAAAARSIRIMAEYLERHPEALLKGKSGQP